jgi:hypothetical protein
LAIPKQAQINYSHSDDDCSVDSHSAANKQCLDMAEIDIRKAPSHGVAEGYSSWLLGVDIQSETSITKHFNGKETFGLVALGDLLENGDRFLISACVRSDRLASEERERSLEIDQPFEMSHFCGEDV